MRSSHKLDRVVVSFDEDNLVPNAGLVAPAELAQKLGVGELVDERVRLTGPGKANSGIKALTVVGAMLAGGDSIDDTDVLRAGAVPKVFDQTRAPSTIGTWLRCFTWAAVRMLDAVLRVVLGRAWAAGLGPDLAAPLTIDCDSTICETYGTKKQGGVFGHTMVRGYHPMVSSCAQTQEVLHARMRGGNAHSARGAAGFIRETIARVRAAGARGPLTVRADSAFYSKGFLWACREADARFSVTVKMNPSIRRAIDGIPDDAWTKIPYWLEGGADVAEVPYRCFAGRHALKVRLIVRRVRRLAGADPPGVHPRALDPAGRRRRVGHRHHRHPAPLPAVHAGPAGALGPPAAPARAHELALAAHPHAPPCGLRRHPRPRLVDTRRPVCPLRPHPTAPAAPPASAARPRP